MAVSSFCYSFSCWGLDGVVLVKAGDFKPADKPWCLFAGFAIQIDFM